MVIISAIIVSLVYAFTLNPDIVYLFMCLGLLIGSCGTLGLLYIPKFHGTPFSYSPQKKRNVPLNWRFAGIYTNVAVESSNFKRTNSIIGSFPGVTSNSSEMSNVSSEEMEKIKAQRSELAKKNAELEQKVREAQDIVVLRT